MNRGMIAEIAAMRRHGIVRPFRALRAARTAGVELALACAILDKETGGGHNLFGHDRDAAGNVIWHGQTGRVDVTKERYRDYLAFRKRTGLMQGVGPVQLTWWSFQDEADRAGGCWKPYPNMLVGFRLIRRNIDARRDAGDPAPMRTAVRMYNGSGPAAEAYADDVMRRRQEWTQRLREARRGSPRAAS